MLHLLDKTVLKNIFVIEFLPAKGKCPHISKVLSYRCRYSQINKLRVFPQKKTHTRRLIRAAAALWCYLQRNHLQSSLT